MAAIKIETAKLAQDKGIVIKGSTYYNEKGVLCAYSFNKPVYKLPTCSQSYLQQILRDDHGWHIIILATQNSLQEVIWTYVLQNLKLMVKTVENEKDFKSYEECLESALVSVLELF